MGLALLIGILVLTLLAGSIIGLVNAGLPMRVRELQREVRALSARIAELENGGEAATAERSEDREEPRPAAEPSPQPLSRQFLPEQDSSAEKAAASRPVRRGDFFRRAERQFAGYWTGILGVLALVAGFSFLAVLTALRMGQFARFLMLVGISVLFWVAALIVGKRKGGALFSAWFRSASGALVLFACLGASAIPWLRWVQSAPQGYALLFLGLLVNLYFALRGRYQLFVAFHTLISLTALAAAPPSVSALAAAALVTGVCSLPGSRRPWGLHLLLAESAFFAFVVYWSIRQGLPLPPAGTAGIDLRAFAALLAGLLPGLAAPWFVAAGFSRMLLSARGASWLFLGIGTTALAGSMRWVSLVFAALALAAYLPGRLGLMRLDRKARRLDTVAGVVLAAAAALGLGRLELDLFIALTAGALLAGIACADSRGDRLVRRVSASLAAGISLLLFAAAFFAGILKGDPFLVSPLNPLQSGIALFLLAGFLLLEIGLFFRAPSLTQSLLAAAAGLSAAGLFSLAFAMDMMPDWLVYSGGLILPLLGAALILKRLRPVTGISAGVLVFGLLSHAAALGLVDASLTLAGRSLLFVLLLVHAAFLILAASVRHGKRSVPVFPGVLLAVADFSLLVLVLTERMKPWVTLSLWALISIALYALWFLLRRRRRDLLRSLTAAGAGLALITSLLVLFSVVMETADLNRLQRILQEVLAAAAVLVWARREDSGRAAVRPWLLLAAAVFPVVFAAAETGSQWTALILFIASVLLLGLGLRGFPFMRGFYPISVLLFWCGTVALPLFAVDFDAMRIFTFGRDWWLALVSALTALLYIAVSYTAGPQGKAPVPEDGKLAPLRRAMNAHRHGVLFVPFFISIGLFFFLSFRGPVLTALLIIESFAVFSLSLLLKARSFRPFSFGLLLFSLGRLLLFDMAEADTLERALVFIIAGAVLLGMNWMYTHLQGRQD